MLRHSSFRAFRVFRVFRGLSHELALDQYWLGAAGAKTLGHGARRALVSGFVWGQSALAESGAVDAYLGFLKSGGSKFPLETLKAAGVDMTTPKPIESTLVLFERRLGELEELL